MLVVRKRLNNWTIKCKIQHVGWINLWVFAILGLWVFSLSVRSNWIFGMWSMIAYTVTPTCSPPNPKSKYLIFPCATCFNAIFWRTSRLAAPILVFCVRCNWWLHCCVCVKLESACVRKLWVFGVQIQATSWNPYLLSTFRDVLLQGWPDRVWDCGCGPPACICEPQIAEPIGNHERSHPRVQGFFGGGGNVGLLGFPISIGVLWDRPCWNGSPCSTNANSFSSSCNHWFFSMEW